MSHATFLSEVSVGNDLSSINNIQYCSHWHELDSIAFKNFFNVSRKHRMHDFTSKINFVSTFIYCNLTLFGNAGSMLVVTFEAIYIHVINQNAMHNAFSELAMQASHVLGSRFH